ncbi:MAG: VCBS repeat-containing protein, partial [Kofleriaceae bacterium]|nr:VCBS repeat-containing protein [Kofleriaceae bacterium]
GTLDVTIATPDGLVAYTSTYGELSPLDVQTELVGGDGNSLAMKRIYTIGPLTVGAFVDLNGTLAHLVADFLDPTNPVGGLPCGQNIPIAAFSSDDVYVHQTSRTGAATTDFVVSLVTGTGASKKLCVMAIHKDNVFARPVIFDITPPSPPTLSKVPVLVDLTADADPCPSLIDVDGGPAALRKWDGAMVGGHCGFKLTPQNGDAMQPMVAASPGATVIGHAPLVPTPLAAAGDALVLSDGIYAYEPNAGTKYRLVYRSTRRLARVVAEDIDGDGHVDLALGADGQDDLDLLFRYDNPFYGIISDALFELRRIDTAGVVTTINIDDFDGNGKMDVAYTEPVADHQRLMVLYSSGDLPDSAVQVGAFPTVSSIARIAFGDSSDMLSVAKDLFVLLPDSKATLLHGSPQRTMLAYFDPRSEGGATNLRDTTIFRATAIGHFAPTSGTDYPDIVGLAPPKVAPTGTGTATVRAWSVPVTADGLDGTQSDGLAVNNVTDCSSGGSGANLCIEDATYLAWPVAADRDVVFAVDRAPTPHAAVFDPRSATGTTLTAMPATLPIPPNTEIRSLHSGDVDADGKADLIATFAPASTKTQINSAVLVCQMNDTGIPSDCEDIAPRIVAAAPSTIACVDAAPGRLGYRDPTIAPAAGLDLLVLCRDAGSTLYRVTKTADAYDVTALSHVAGTLSAVQIGDVTGDGVDDVIGIAGEPGARSLVVFPQCTSRDSATCARTGEE